VAFVLGALFTYLVGFKDEVESKPKSSAKAADATAPQAQLNQA